MRWPVRFLTLLLVGLGFLAVVAYVVLTQTTRDWFEADLLQRARLATAAAREGLQAHWSDGAQLTSTLADITRDEHVVAAAACSSAGDQLAATESYPPELTCRSLLERMRKEAPLDAEAWATMPKRSSTAVHVGVIRVGDRARARGAVIVVQDLEYLRQRESTTRDLLLVAFVVLALGASLMTLVASRLALKGWTLELRRALTGNAKTEFQPLVSDVRSIAERLLSERPSEPNGGHWSPERLRATLTQYLHGEHVVVLANREPYLHERTATGIEVQHPASGLVTALEPIMRACSGVWVAHGSGSADRDTVDAHDRVRVPPGEESYWVRRVWLSEEEESGYYYGFANEGLWPLCHVADTRPTFRAEDYEYYQQVNRRFADAVCEEVDSEDPIVLVQDYHFALAPKLIRERLPQATIITFWHIPWPNAERIAICPWGVELISGLLGSSVVGFHTQQHCNNFIDSVDALVESRIDREANAVVQGAQRTLVKPYPISIEWPVRWLDQVPSASESRRLVCQELGLADNALVGVGIDRLDYTKGIEERLLAVDQLLDRFPELRGRFTFVQLAAPSRTKIPRYRELDEHVEAVAAEINAKWSVDGYRPIILRRAHHEPTTVFKYYRAADVCYVSSLHDGMNLVAKEFVAARDDERGVLVLSQFTGAARDLTEALIVNPYDLRQASDALAAALHMSVEEQRERMRSMRRLLSEFNVYRWAGRMLIDAGELRRKERMLGRLGALGSLSNAEAI